MEAASAALKAQLIAFTSPLEATQMPCPCRSLAQ
jgi:hypothetical protein